MYKDNRKPNLLIQTAYCGRYIGQIYNIPKYIKKEIKLEK